MLFWPPIYFLCFRKVYFDLIVEKEAFISGMETLEEAVSSFLHICFVTNMHYPVGSGNVSTYLQRYVAKLDENGTTATRTRKDQVAKEDKAARSLKKVFEEFNKKMYVILSNLDWLQSPLWFLLRASLHIQVFDWNLTLKSDTNQWFFSCNEGTKSSERCLSVINNIISRYGLNSQWTFTIPALNFFDLSPLCNWKFMFMSLSWKITAVINALLSRWTQTLLNESLDTVCCNEFTVPYRH